MSILPEPQPPSLATRLNQGEVSPSPAPAGRSAVPEKPESCGQAALGLRETLEAGVKTLPSKLSQTSPMGWAQTVPAPTETGGRVPLQAWQGPPQPCSSCPNENIRTHWRWSCHRDRLLSLHPSLGWALRPVCCHVCCSNSCPPPHPQEPTKTPHPGAPSLPGNPQGPSDTWVGTSTEKPSLRCWKGWSAGAGRRGDPVWPVEPGGEQAWDTAALAERQCHLPGAR